MSASKSILSLQIMTLVLVLIACVMNAIVENWVAFGILVAVAVLNVIHMVLYRRSRAGDEARSASETAAV
ncbi:hypothetical protein MUK71_15160 [Arthrobacter zhangbolii]|uniref:Lipoprotein n=1 Tax=Arthrobacter zhangbolii TaxID=2886936 RepID=A0A9X1M742_9MICC|nr:MULTISPECIES: hypothetical protein [Arthrobacter]MCC3272236.1 hypothetical protein [Arthrobacter zhangbolii]MCC3294289.1 hypothetical protein [Arthrobacter zhangbolii]MDN3903298.1 hypothetical protein [Arthrobacter sp. YD2]UON91894.1 hypothetical protein MUK71_15160 [Arthrobacter zhangbolii]